MKAVVQRVRSAHVEVDGERVGAIEAGVLVLLGVAEGDDEDDARWMAEKVVSLRIFEDDHGKMNLSLTDTGGALLAVSQFTLLGDCRKGRRPSFVKAARPEQAEALYERFLCVVEELDIPTAKGRFQTHMAVSLVNDGPVTNLGGESSLMARARSARGRSRMLDWSGVVVPLFVCVSSVAAAQQPDVVVSRLFAATADGAFLTYSWGEHWTRLRGDLRGFTGELRAFACLGSTVFAGGSDGLFISEDFGENYRLVETFEGKDVTTFQAARMFGLEPTLFAGTATGLYRSTDGGAAWDQIGAEMIQTPVRSLVWPGPELFVASDSGLFVTDDAGDSWDRIEGGLPRVPILSITLSQVFGLDPTIFVGTRGAGLYRSTDGGEVFELLEHELLEDKSVEAVYWWGDLLLIGTEDGLLLSNDVAETVREVQEIRGRAVTSINVPFPDGLSQSDILIGTDAGAYKSSDGALSFRLVSEGLGTPRVLELATFPPPPRSSEPLRR